MPQDHASWDRKELLRQRKHDRPEPSFEPAFRWRASPTTPSSHRDFSRYGSGAADFRRPSCHGKQGGRHQFVEDTSHGYTSSRSSTRVFENDYYRQSGPRGDWRYNRNFRDDRPLSQKDWKCNTWDMSNGSSRAFERPGSLRNGRRSVDERPQHSSDTHTTLVNSWDQANSAHQPDIENSTPVRTLKIKNEQKFSDQRLSYPSDPQSECVSLFERPSSENNYGNKSYSPAKQCNDLMVGRSLANDNSLDPPILNADQEGTWEQLHLKDSQDNTLHGTSDLEGAKICDKESSLGANGKLPVWNRSGSFASQSSGYSHSSSLKSLGAVESSDGKNEVLPKIVAVTRSFSGDATACATTTHFTEEMSSRKKQRLGWGEGLAKYEKKKVDVNTNEDGTTLLENSTEELHSLNKIIADRSPTTAIPEYGSPTTPSSVGCSSSPGFADKSSAKAAIAASDVSNMCRSPSPVSSIPLEQFPINIEEIDNNSMERFGCLLNELLATDDSGTGDSISVQLTSMNRLLAWKGDILKAVEMTESEIDLLENKHRTLMLEGGRHCRVVGSSSHLCEGDLNVAKEQEASCILGPKVAASSVAETLVRDPPVHQAVLAMVPDVFEDSPGQVKSLSQSLVTVENNEDILPIPSMKASASSKEVNTTAFANQETVELSSADDSMASNEDLLCAKLLSSNKKYASESSEVFNELLPRDFSSFDGSRFPDICQSQFNSHVNEKIAERVELLRAREKILLLQFKAFQLAWKKDMHRLASAKYQPKSNRRTELYPNAKNSGHLKLPQPVRLRFSSSAPRRDSVAYTTELVSYMEKLLHSTRLKPIRDILKMPAMILDEKERLRSRFISSNGLIEDPCDVEKERTMINPWTSEEKETFLNMLAMHGKDFKKIATYLTQKTTADCIDYYYKNHKSDCFRKIKKQFAFGKEGKHTYMLAPRKKWKRDMGAASLDILGAVSIIAANAGKVASTRQISSKRITLRGCSSSNSLQHDGNNSEGCSYSFEIPRKRALGADVLAVGPLSSEQINSCVRTSVDSRERCIDHLKFDPVVKKPRISHTTHNEKSNEDDDSCSEESCGETVPIHWTDDERSAFIQGFSLFGKNFASISKFVRTRSQDQCRVFFSKVRKSLGLECVQSGSGNVSASVSVDNAVEGGGSDLEEPCQLESNSAICNDGVSAKMGLSSPTSPFNMNQEGANHLETANVKAGLSRSEQENGVTYLRFKDGTNLVKNAYINGGVPGQVSERCRDLVDNNTVESQCQTTRKIESQCQAAGKIKSNDLLPMEIDEGNFTSVAVSSDPLYCGSSVLSNMIMESPIESSRKGSGGQGTALPKQSLKNQDGVMSAADKTRSSGLETEAAPSSFRYPECLHHVPIEVSTVDLVGVSVPQGNPNCLTESESPNSLVGQVVKTNNLGWQFSDVNLDLDGKLGILGLVNPEQNGQLSGTSTESYQNPWRSVTQDPSRISRSKSDVIVKTQRTGEGFSLKKCTSSATKPLTIFHKDGRSGHSRSHSFSLSDTERLDKNGDVKLFGTVLTADENGSKHKPSPGGSIRSSSTLSRDHDTGHQYINQQHLQNVPITSYGFWDGNRIQTGLTSLPESAKLLASCPEAYSAHLKQQAVSTKEIQLDVSGILRFGKLIEDRAEVSSGKDEGNIGGVNGVAEAAT